MVLEAARLPAVGEHQPPPHHLFFLAIKYQENGPGFDGRLPPRFSPNQSSIQAASSKQSLPKSVRSSPLRSSSAGYRERKETLAAARGGVKKKGKMTYSRRAGVYCVSAGYILKLWRISFSNSRAE